MIQSNKIKVLIADDSAFMRLLISQILTEHQNIVVVDTAADGKDAVEKTLLHQPDIILLDLMMSPYDGLYAIRQIMQQMPTPIVLLSGAEKSQTHLVLDALQCGAVDFIPKPQGAFNSKIRDIKEILINKIFTFAKINPLVLKNNKRNNLVHTFMKEVQFESIVIGASTGGTAAIESILLNLPQNFPIPIFIVQHIPMEFGVSFMMRLNQELPFEVKIAEDEEIITPNKVYIAPSNVNLHLAKSLSGKIHFQYTTTQYPEYNFPSVNALMFTASEVYHHKLIGVLLTGMGKDGVMGMEKIYHNGGLTIAQDQKSCIVFGMPRAAIEAGFVKYILSLNDIPNFLVNIL